MIAAFFAEDKPKAREKRRATIESWVAGKLGNRSGTKPRAAAATLANGRASDSAVSLGGRVSGGFRREIPGFDAIVGNPPFAGKNTIIAGNRDNYLPWLQTLHEGAHGNADLVAHFFRRLLGCFGKAASSA